MEEHKHHFQIRPRFKVDTSLSSKAIEDKLSRALSLNPSAVEGKVVPGHATLQLPQKDRHYWSPQLTLSYDRDDTSCLLRGMYSPQPEVWTMFFLFYSVIGFAVLVISIVGYVQWSLGNPADILWLVPILLVIFLSLYLVSYTGQRMGKKQMIILHRFVESTLSIEIMEF